MGSEMEACQSWTIFPYLRKLEFFPVIHITLPYLLDIQEFWKCFLNVDNLQFRFPLVQS